MNVTTTHDTVTKQFLDIMMHFISKDFDHKRWNYAEQFSTHIAPEKNEAVQLKKERFNRLPMVVHAQCTTWKIYGLSWTSTNM